MDEEYTHTLTAAEIEALQARIANPEDDSKIPLTDREREYVLSEIHQLYIEARGEIINYLMHVSTEIQALRAEDEPLAELGDERATFHLLKAQALERVIADTAVYISSISDEDTMQLSFQRIHAHILEKTAATLDYNEYEAYKLLAGFFED